MKKKMGVVIAALVGAGVIGLGVYQSDAAEGEPKLNADEIHEMVESKYGGTVTELELEKGINKEVYEIEVKANSLEYDLYVDANTGEVLKEKEDKDDDAKVDSKASDAKKSQLKVKVMEVEKAKEIALEQFNGTVKEFELDEDDGRLVYELEIKNGREEAEFEIDAITGEIIELEIDDEDWD